MDVGRAQPEFVARQFPRRDTEQISGSTRPVGSDLDPALLPEPTDRVGPARLLFG